MGSSNSKKRIVSHKEIILQDVNDFKKNFNPPDYVEIDNYSNNFNSKINYQHLQQLIDDFEKNSIGSDKHYESLKNLYGYMCLLSNISKFPNTIYESISHYAINKISGHILQSARFILENPPKKKWSLINGLYVIDN